MYQQEQVFRPGELSNTLDVIGEMDETKPFTHLRMPDGRVLRLETHELTSSRAFEVDETSSNSDIGNPVEVRIPLVEERLDIQKRVVGTGKVILQKTVQEYEHTLDEPLALRTYDIERKILNQPIESVPSVREEGETTVYPVVEEQLILTKQLILKEEIHVRRRDDVRIDNQVVTLKREHLTVVRESSGDADRSTSAE